MPWNSPIIIALFTVGGVLGLSFIFVEGKVAKFPVIPGHVFKIRTVVSVYISIFFTGLIYFGEIYYIPIYLQVPLPQNCDISPCAPKPIANGCYYRLSMVLLRLEVDFE
jgi:hypothetical protein